MNDFYVPPALSKRQGSLMFREICNYTCSQSMIVDLITDQLCIGDNVSEIDARRFPFDFRH
jgi:hypothetical protein